MAEIKKAEQWVKPYGDTLNDGRVQLSFTLPVALDETSKEGAKRLAALMGLDEPAVVHAEEMGQGFSFTSSMGNAGIRSTCPASRWSSPSMKCSTRKESTS